LGFSLFPEKKHANDTAYDGDSYKYREHLNVEFELVPNGRTRRQQCIGPDYFVGIRSFSARAANYVAAAMLQSVKSAVLSDGMFHSFTICRLPN
jgi:hypothetical protein